MAIELSKGIYFLDPIYARGYDIKFQRDASVLIFDGDGKLDYCEAS